MGISMEELKSYLSILNIEVQNTIDDINLRQVRTAFLRLVLLLHPDKAGHDSKAAFQEVKTAYEKVRDFIKNKSDDVDDAVSDDVELFFDDNFEKFNFPHENKGSFTVLIENSLAQAWQDCLTSLLGEPKVNIKSNDVSWKVSYTQEKTIDITIHIYKNPKNKTGSKLLLQGSIQSMICSYVFSELPKIYKLVCDTKPKFLEDEVKRKPKTPVKALVKCDKCRFKSSMIQMKMHIRNIHTKKPERTSKRLMAFTPQVKQYKRIKSESVSEENSDLSFLLVPCGPIDDGGSVLEEVVIEETTKEINELNKIVNMDVIDILSCSKCDFETECESDLQKHLDTGIHESCVEVSYKCEKCEFSFKNESLLKDHDKNHHQEILQSVLTCSFGDYTCYHPMELKNHEVEKHGMVYCEKCDYSALDQEIMKKHMTTHTGRILFQCGKCEYESTRQALFDEHMETKHPVIQDSVSDTKRRCDKCERSFEAGFIFDAHNCIITSKYKCEQCCFTAVILVELLELHILV